MKIEKLPSGNYRVRKMHKGKSYSFIFESKPTQREIVDAFTNAVTNEEEKKKKITFYEACNLYIDSRKNVLSPSTIREYRNSANRFTSAFLKKNIYEITQVDIQKEINYFASSRSPKTVRNYHAFISSVFAFLRPDFHLSTTLPQRRKNMSYIPSQDDVRALLDYSKGTEYEIPLILACYGLRRSEICALSISDIEGNIIHIQKAMVIGEGNKWTIKNYTKTEESQRDVFIPDELVYMIKTKGYVYNMHPNNISDFMSDAEKKLGIEHFSIHKLRHFFASQLAPHVSEADLLKLGGWSSPYVMKSVYRHNLIDRDMKAKKEAAEKMKSIIM